MHTHTTSGRILAIAAGLLFTGGALGILLEDVVLHAAPFAMKHALTIVTVAGTIFAGHLAVEARRSRAWLSMAGFAVLFLAGTVLTVYASVGRQAEHTMIAVADAEAAASARASIAPKLERAEEMLAKSQADMARECQSGEGPKCKGIKATVEVYEASVRGHKADLEKLGPPRVVVPEARRAGELAAVFGFDGKTVEAGAILAVPFLTTVFFEVGSIVCFGFGFRPSSRRRPVSVTVSSETLAAVETVAANDPTPPAPTPPARRASTRDEARADIIQLVTRGAIPSQETLSERWGVPKGTVSKWLAIFEAEGHVTRETHGRCKAVRAA